jgi:hypothetical protein
MDLRLEFSLCQFVGGTLVDVALGLHLRVVRKAVHLKKKILIKISAVVKLRHKAWLCTGSKVVEHSIHNAKIEDSNRTTGTESERGGKKYASQGAKQLL